MSPFCSGRTEDYIQHLITYECEGFVSRRATAVIMSLALSEAHGLGSTLGAHSLLIVLKIVV